MRLPIIGLTVAGLLLGQAAYAVPTCVRHSERSALDVEGLKSELMVTALACGTKSQYNAFVQRFLPDLNRDEREIARYFRKEYGRRGQKEQDGYITQLANGQSQDGTKQGTLFCAQRVPMFDEVMALRNGAELPEYAAGKAIPHPAMDEACKGRAPVMRVAARRRAVSHRRVVHHLHPVKHHR